LHTDCTLSDIKLIVEKKSTTVNKRKKGLNDPHFKNQHEDKILHKIKKMSKLNRQQDNNLMRNIVSQQYPLGSQLEELEEETDSFIPFTTPNVPTFNSFGFLNNDVAAASTSNNSESSTAAGKNVNNKKDEKSKIIKTKPIYIKEKKFSDIQLAMNSLGITKFSMRIINGGIKLMIDDLDNFKKSKKFFADNKIEFYTYELSDEKLFKVVLYGLPSFECSDVQKFLEVANIFPKEVKKMNLKQKRFEDETVYMISFAAGTTNINELKKVRYVNYISIKWAHYVKRGNVTQCRRCQQFSHGTRNCYINPKCVKCGDAHLSESCPHQQLFESKTKALKCANCKEEHPANYSNCQVRLNYIEFRKQLIEKERSKQGQKRIPKFQLNNNNHFPPPPQPTSKSPHWNFQQQQHQQHPATHNAWNKEPIQTTSFGKGDLFSSKEIAVITSDVYSKLSNCRNKYDQIMVITEIVAKYIFDG
jgi:hypothetical protein